MALSTLANDSRQPVDVSSGDGHCTYEARVVLCDEGDEKVILELDQSWRQRHHHIAGVVVSVDHSGGEAVSTEDLESRFHFGIGKLRLKICYRGIYHNFLPRVACDDAHHSCSERPQRSPSLVGLRPDHEARKSIRTFELTPVSSTKTSLDFGVKVSSA